MKKAGRRLPKGYNGTELTTRQIREIVPAVLSDIHMNYEERHDLIIASWPNLVGPKIAKFTTPQSFSEGIFKVKVHNSTLYSLLNQTEKAKLLFALRKKFPKVEIKDLVFRMG